MFDESIEDKEKDLELDLQIRDWFIEHCPEVLMVQLKEINQDFDDLVFTPGGNDYYFLKANPKKIIHQIVDFLLKENPYDIANHTNMSFIAALKTTERKDYYKSMLHVSMFIKNLNIPENCERVVNFVAIVCMVGVLGKLSEEKTLSGLESMSDF